MKTFEIFAYFENKRDLFESHAIRKSLSGELLT